MAVHFSFKYLIDPVREKIENIQSIHRRQLQLRVPSRLNARVWLDKTFKMEEYHLNIITLMLLFFVRPINNKTKLNVCMTRINLTCALKVPTLKKI